MLGKNYTKTEAPEYLGFRFKVVPAMMVRKPSNLQPSLRLFVGALRGMRINATFP